MPRTLDLTESRAIPVEAAVAFEATLAMPPHRFLRERFGPVPPLSGAPGDPERPWGTPGQWRTLRFRGGGSMRQELLEVERPGRFADRITGITGPLAAVAVAIDSEWLFDPVGTGVRVTWRSSVSTHRGVVGPPRAVVARLWRGYARRGLEHLGAELLVARPG